MVNNTLFEYKEVPMYTIKNFLENDDISILDEKGPFAVIEYKRDLSITPATAITAYFSSEMKVRRRQVICKVGPSNITLQAGAMQWTAGDVSSTTGLKGVGDFFGKAIKSKVTGETAIKPEYTGNGTLVLEPTYKHILLLDLNDWNNAVVLEDGLFLACESNIQQKAVMRSNLSSAVAGGQGLFNLSLQGQGIAVIESPTPKEELIEIYLENDVLKVDGNLAIAWSNTLEFTVERSGKTLLGSAASGEGLVNVFRGTGKILLSPVEGALLYQTPGQF